MAIDRRKMDLRKPQITFLSRKHSVEISEGSNSETTNNNYLLVMYAFRTDRFHKTKVAMKKSDKDRKNMYI